MRLGLGLEWFLERTKLFEHGVSGIFVAVLPVKFLYALIESLGCFLCWQQVLRQILPFFSEMFITTSSKLWKSSSPVLYSYCQLTARNLSSTYNRDSMPCSPVKVGQFFFFVMSTYLWIKGTFSSFSCWMVGPYGIQECFKVNLSVELTTMIVYWRWYAFPIDCNISARDWKI